MSHVIRGLEGNSVYEAIVQAKNRYGWNEVNDFVTNCELGSRIAAAHQFLSLYISLVVGSSARCWFGYAYVKLMLKYKIK